VGWRRTHDCQAALLGQHSRLRAIVKLAPARAVEEIVSASAGTCDDRAALWLSEN